MIVLVVQAGDDLSRRTYLCYRGDSRKRALSYALRKAEKLWPDQCRYEAHIAEGSPSRGSAPNMCS